VSADTQYTFSLVVNDGTDNSSADQVVVTVKQVNKLPVANAGADQTVNEGASVVLDASGSSDLDGDALTYVWTAPFGITLSSTTTQKPTFTAPVTGKDTTYRFSLIVNDGSNNSVKSETTVSVKFVNSINGAIADNFIFYPNPVSDYLNIKNHSGITPGTKISVSDLTGKELVRTQISKGDTRVDLRKLVPGTYILSIKTNILFNYKIIKK